MHVFFVILLSLLALILLLLAWILFARIDFRVDTRAGIYRVSFGKFIAVFYSPEEKNFILTVFGWKRLLKPAYPIKAKPGAEELPGEKQVRAKKKPIPFRKLLRKMRAVLRSFHVTRFELDLDTDDVVMDAYLYPLFFLLSGKRSRLLIRFDGQSSLVLEANIRIVRIVRAMLTR
jgi:hypothetical protein